MKYSGKGLSFSLRYSKGIYFSPLLEKAVNYAHDFYYEGKKCKILICCKLVLGKTFFPIDDDDHYEKFDLNFYDSIYGSPNISYTIN